MALTRLKINLATFSYKNKGLEWGLIVLVCAIILAMSAYLIHSAVVRQEEILSYSNKIAKLEWALGKEERGGRPAKINLDSQDLKQLESDMSFVEGLIIRDIFPWDMVLAAVERNMPKNVYLERLETDSSTKKLNVRGTAGSMATISVFLKNLDLNEIFRTSQLVRFSVEEGEEPGSGPSRLIHFDIECTLDGKVIMEKLRSWAQGSMGSSKKALGKSK